MITQLEPGPPWTKITGSPAPALGNRRPYSTCGCHWLASLQERAMNSSGYRTQIAPEARYVWVRGANVDITQWGLSPFALKGSA